MTRDHPIDSTEYCCVEREQFEAAHAPSLWHCRNVTDRSFVLAHEIDTKGKHLLRRVRIITAGQRHVDRVEIESGRLELIVGRSRHFMFLRGQEPVDFGLG